MFEPVIHPKAIKQEMGPFFTAESTVLTSLGKRIMKNFMRQYIFDWNT